MAKKVISGRTVLPLDKVEEEKRMDTSLGKALLEADEEYKKRKK